MTWENMEGSRLEYNSCHPTFVVCNFSQSLTFLPPFPPLASLEFNLGHPRLPSQAHL